jgi:hypothetical protein
MDRPQPQPVPRPFTSHSPGETHSRPPPISAGCNEGGPQTSSCSEAPRPQLRRSHRGNASLSPIRLLPAEILCYIFEMSLPVQATTSNAIPVIGTTHALGEPRTLASLWIFGYVCRWQQWRALTLSLPTLWSLPRRRPQFTCEIFLYPLLDTQLALALHFIAEGLLLFLFFEALR